MSYATAHGFRPADEFLNTALRADFCAQVTFHFKENPNERSDYRYNYWLQRAGDERHISLNPYALEWKNGCDPTDVDWPELTFTLQPKDNHEGGSRRTIHFRIGGLEKVTGLKEPEKEFFVSLHGGNGNGNYFDQNSPVVLEFKRRWTIEEAERLSTEAIARLNKHLGLGPFMTD